MKNQLISKSRKNKRPPQRPLPPRPHRHQEPKIHIEKFKIEENIKKQSKITKIKQYSIISCISFILCFSITMICVIIVFATYKSINKYKVKKGCVIDYERKGCGLSKDNKDVVTEEWFENLMKYEMNENEILGEYAGNIVWYKMNDEGEVIMNHECSCKADDYVEGRSERRSVVRYSIKRDDGWSWYIADNNPMVVNETYVKMKPDDDEPLIIHLFNLEPSLYSLYIYGTIEKKNRTSLNRIWNPAPMEFNVFNKKTNEKIQNGLLLLKQGFNPRRMQGFHFHVVEKGNYRVEFNMHHTAQETAEILWIRFVDQLYLIPNEKIKNSQNLDISTEGVPIIEEPLTQERLDKDESIWNNYVHFNMHTNFDGHDPMFSQAPVNGGNWEIEDWKGIVYYKVNLPENSFPTLTLYDTVNPTENITQEDILNFTPLPNENYPDYGACFYHDDQYNCQIATKMTTIYLQYFATFVDTEGSHWDGKFGRKCFEGDMVLCHEGALAFVRLSFDWPAIEMSLRDVGYNSHSPDLQYNTDWTTHTRRNGKFYYSGWSGANTAQMLKAYDELYPYISSSQNLASSINRFIPWVKTPDDVIRLLDRYFVFTSVRDFQKQIIRTNSIPQQAGSVLGVHKFTFFLYDYTKIEDSVYPLDGTIQELYAKAYNRDGVHYIGSCSYAIGYAEDLQSKAITIKKAKEEGYLPKMDMSDVATFSKVSAGLYYITNIYVAGGYRLTYGDASGGPHNGIKSLSYVGASCKAFQNAYDLYSDVLAAWGMVYGCSVTDSTIVSLANTIPDPIQRAKSRIIHSTAAIIEIGTDEDLYTNKHAVFLKLGVGQGHSHSDFLDLNIFSIGLPMAADIGQRNEGDLWTRPASAWSYQHNHAFGHDLSGVLNDDNNPKFAGLQVGEPYLSSFGEQSIRGCYYDNVFTLKREVVVMDMDEANNIYVFDVQRVKGGSHHTFNFHGSETHQLNINVAMSPSSERWIDRHLENTQKEGIAVNKLEAIWEMSRESRQYVHSFNGGGTINTFATEQTVLGTDYNDSLPVANTKLTLLGQASSKVFEGFSYSEHYSYAFPFLFVQSDGNSPTDETTYPAVYEMYRGGTPLLSDISYISIDPVVDVTVTTQGGQIDHYIDDKTTGKLTVVSRDNSGDVRFAKLNGGTNLAETGVSISVSKAVETAQIININYITRTITVDNQLPQNPLVVLSNPFRNIHVQLYGQGTVFTFKDDLLVSEGTITEFTNLNNGEIIITTNQGSTDHNFVLFSDSQPGNRHPNGFTYTNEDYSIQFRNKTILKKPSGTFVSSMFTDINNDGLVNLKAYDIGIEEIIMLIPDVTIKRFGSQYRIKSNVPSNGNVQGNAFNVQESDNWQDI